ncbi:MAG: methyltransferase domain-containing protein [Gemmatimonadetes bacterium]|nr:methyltransferase domain-containing protein [Gemmatimonadota bacterium]
MKDRLLEYLACPDCGGDLDVSGCHREGAEIMRGRLVCLSCDVRYEIVRGVPRFAPTLGETEGRTARAFGYEWTHYSELGDRYRQQFLDWIHPVRPEFLAGKTVLEGGCGKGRHTLLAAEFGAADVIAVDLSDAVDVAFQNTRAVENAHVVQGDIHRLPVKAVFDYAFTVGVLHHLPDPERGFASLVSKIEVGGHVSAWVYGREGNGWIVHLVSPVRESLTSRLPPRWLDRISAVLTLPLFFATRLVYAPSHGRLLGLALPYGEYLSYIASFPFREQRSIVFDHLAAPISHYIRGEDFIAWFEERGLEEVTVERHNGNSWRGFARVPATVDR